MVQKIKNFVETKLPKDRMGSSVWRFIESLSRYPLPFLQNLRFSENKSDLGKAYEAIGALVETSANNF